MATLKSLMRAPVISRDATSWLVQAHHPDMRRMPAPSPARVSERTCGSLVWNTFRTLALVDPSLWLRQLHARLFEFDQRYRAPETLDVRLWVPAAPAMRGGHAGEVTVDVLLESEHTRWALLTLFESDLVFDAQDASGPDPIIRAVDALAWTAGARDLFVGLISSGPRTAPVATRLTRRYAASPHLLEHRLSRPALRRNVRGLGVGTWQTVAAVLEECRRAPSLDEPERQAVRRCLDWFGALGVSRDV
jgi:hypothetical protein